MVSFYTFSVPFLIGVRLEVPVIRCTFALYSRRLREKDQDEEFLLLHTGVIVLQFTYISHIRLAIFPSR